MFPVLDDAALARVQEYGATRVVKAGEVLFNPGDQHTRFIAVLSGKLQIETEECGSTHLVAEHGRGSFSGEIDMFSNRRALVRGVVTEAGEMVFLERRDFRRFLAAHSDLSELIIRAFILRRMALLYHERGDLILIGDEGSSRVLEIRSFLMRNGHPNRLIDPRKAPEDAERIMDYFDLKTDDLPAAIYQQREVLRDPTTRKLADLVGLSHRTDPEQVFDVAVVGVGPAGLAAAVNAAAEGLSVVAIERLAPGGQAGTSSKIENYPAFPTGISGQALSGRMMLQAQKFGTEIITPCEIRKLDCDSYPYTVEMEDGAQAKARSIVIATGAKWRRLGLEKEAELENAGIYYGATAMESALCDGEAVVIVGGGNSAGQAAIFLSRRTSHVHIMVRRDGLAATMSDYLIQRIEAEPKITVHTHTEITHLDGDDHLEQLTWRENRTGEETSKPIRHLFIMIGAIPNTEWLGDCVMLDSKGFVKTGADLPTDHLVTEKWHVHRLPYIGETSQPGVFAVGDVRSGSVKRVASAVGEGAIAAQFLYKVVNPDQI